MKSWLVSLLICVTTPALAAVPTWKMIPSESSIEFSGTMNDAPMHGVFKKFTSEVAFDKDKLNESHVKVIVDIASVSTSYGEIADTLKTSEWFDAHVFPQAVFETKQITKLSDNNYQAKGTLTIRNKSQKITMNFTEQQLAIDKLQVTGSALVSRLAFGVGQGEWKGTDEVKDNVQVNFQLTVDKE